MAAGSSRRRGRTPLDPWRILFNILSGIFMTVGVILILLAIAEIVVYIIDSLINGNGSYLGWWSTPLLMVLVSIPFFLGYFVVNLNRYRFYHVLKDKLSIKPPPRRDTKRPGKMDKIEL